MKMLEFPAKFMDSKDIESRKAQLEVFEEEIYPIYDGYNITLGEAFIITLLQNVTSELRQLNLKEDNDPYQSDTPR